MIRRVLVGAATLGAFAALVLYTTPRVSGYAEGAPAGFSGGFGEPSCHACHFDSDPDSGPGRVTVDGVPERFLPGEPYPLTITLTRQAMTFGGFQITGRFTEGGAQAGRLAPADGEAGRVASVEQGGVQYVSQTKAGTALTSADTAVWQLVWTAPEGNGPITFHVAANAGNGDGTAEGDFVHTVSVETAPDAGAR